MRSKLKSFLSSMIAALLLATLVIPVAACAEGAASGNTAVYVVSMGNKGLEGVTVTAKSGDKTASGKTNSEGKASFNLDKSLSYTVTFDNLPKGYYTDPSTSYTIKANSTEDSKFYLPSKVITGESVPPTYVYKTGDVVYDFSFTTALGTEAISLAEELESKKAVLLNFWGSLCGNCQVEFPAIESTYQMFKDDFSVFALDPPNAYGDDNTTIIRTLQQWGLNLSFYYGMDSANVYKNFYAPAQSGSFALPVSVIIDRYGVVCEIIVGSESDASKWQAEIAKYVADDYVPDIKDGQTSDDIENFVPDLPADFNAQMSPEADINKAINKTGQNIHFYADGADYSWPWALSSSGDSIVPLGSGHGLSYSVIYADVNIDTDQALLIDYKVSSEEGYDLFEIAVDTDDLGRVTFIDSGNKSWKTALAYVPLTAGSHTIAFVYYKGTIDGNYEDTVYIKNLRIVSTDSKEIPSSDISYYAARDYDARTSTYATYENVKFDSSDGYYHVTGYDNGGKDPYLLLDMTHIIPYTRSSSLYASYISENNCTFGTRNYYNELLSYAYVAGNSAVEGAVPVTKELHDIIDALCKHEANTNGYDYSDKMWLEFCIFYLHFGEGEPMDDPAIGLAYFSAIEAKETAVYDSEKMQTLADEVNAAIDQRAQLLQQNANADTSALDKIIADKTEEYETYLATFNSVDFDTLIVPRGKVVKFTAKEAGVYHFYSVGREDNPEYVCEAQLYDSSLKLHTALSRPVASHDSDTLFREGNESQFHLYYYLDEGETCYLNLMFYSTETLDTMYYAVNKVDDSEVKILRTVTAGFYTSSLDPATLGKIYRPKFVEVELNANDNYYYEKTFNNRILVDFTGATRFSFTHSLEMFINAANSDKPIKVGSVDITFDFTGFSVQIGDETIVGKDYTDEINEYLSKAKEGSKTDPDYGLVEANKELRDILTLFIGKYDELLDEDDWLTFCYYYQYVGANY